MEKIIFDPDLLKKELASLRDQVPDSVYPGLSAVFTGELRDVATADRLFTVSKTSQLRQLSTDSKNDTEGIFVFCGDKFASRPRHMALLFCAVRVKYGMLSPNFLRWHQLSYGTNEPGLTHDYFTLRPQVLVIDSVYENSSIITVEKVRGLISKYNPPVTIVTGAGTCPVDLSHKKLNIEVSRVMRFR